MKIEITSDGQYDGRVVLCVTDAGITVQLYPASGGRIAATDGGGSGGNAGASNVTVGTNGRGCAQCGRTEYPHVHQSSGGGSVTYVGPVERTGYGS